MENCIVETLLASVPGDMPVLGRLVIRAKSTGTAVISTNVLTAQNIQVVAPNGTVIKTETVNPGSNTNVSQDCSGYEYVDFIFPDKYRVARLSCLFTSPASADATYQVVSGDINYMASLGVCGATGALFPDAEISLPSLTYLTYVGATITGNKQGFENIARFAGSVSLVAITAANAVRNYIFSGDLKKFLEDMCANGRESGTLQMQINREANFVWGQTPIVASSFTISITFSATGCVLTKTAGTFLFDSISYNKNTGIWS